MKSTCVVLVVSAAALVSSCRVTPERGEVQREWNSTLRELGINPVYPPREDLQVGDVYVRRGYVDDQKLVPNGGFAPIDLWLATADVRSSLDAFYAARTSLPMTPAEPPGTGAVPASAPVVGPIFSVGDNTRMRTVAFPEFASMNIRAADLRAFIPVEALGLGLGGSWSGKHQVNVKIPVAESCGLPLGQALPLVADNSGGAWVLKSTIADATLLEKLHADVQAWARVAANLPEEQRQRIADDPWLHLDLITEVFYTRAIHVAVSSATSGGARVAAAPLAPTGGGTASPASAPLLPGQGDALARANQLNAELKKIDELNVPGGSMQFLSASDQALSMRRRFDRPIAIGFRAVQLSIDPANGSIVGLGAAANRAGTVTAGLEAEVAQALSSEITTRLQAAQLGAFSVQATTGDALVFKCRALGANATTQAQLAERIKAMAPDIAKAVRAAKAEMNADEQALLRRFEAEDFTVELALEE